MKGVNGDIILTQALKTSTRVCFLGASVLRM